MKRYVWIVASMLFAIPALAQAPVDDTPVGSLGSYALGELAVRSTAGLPNDPVAQLRTFFLEANLPLTKVEEKKLQTVVDAQLKATAKYAPGAPVTDEMRKTNREYFTQLVAVLTPTQQATMKAYQTEQIRLRGGFEGLKLILQEAKVPLTAEQEKQVTSVYDEVHRLGLQASEGQPAVRMTQAQREALAKIPKILTAEQRKAVIDSKLAPQG